MDFATRDATGTRSRSSRAARAAPSSRSRDDGRARTRARASGGPTDAPRGRDPGYYLDRATGARALRAGARLPGRRRMRSAAARCYVAHGDARLSRRRSRRSPRCMLALPLLVAGGAPASDRWAWSLLALLALVPASELAIALVNRGVADARSRPRRCRGSSCATACRASSGRMVVVPTLLTTRAEVEEQIERLEVHYLANPDGDLRFALLSDWTDAPTESVPGDDELLAARARRHRAPEPRARRAARRRRRASCCSTAGGSGTSASGKWMGWERKRGKLHELNRLLRGATDTTLRRRRRATRPRRPTASATSSRSTPTRGCRAAPRAAGRHDGAPAQPAALRRRSARRVVEGYARAPAARHAVAARRPRGLALPALFSGPAGIDPYAAAVSDVYQDLFGRAPTPARASTTSTRSRRRSAGRVPENTLLSHDLFEGIFARAGLVTDVELFEEFPAHYEVAARAAASLGARRLAAAALDPRARRDGRAGRDPRSGAGRCRQPAPHAARRRPPSCRWSPAWIAARRVAPRRGRRSSSSTLAVPALLPVLGGPDPAAARASRSAATCARSAAIVALAASQIGLDAHDARPPGLADGRRDRAHARPPVRDRRRLLEWVTAAQAKARLAPRSRAASTGGWPARVAARRRGGALVAVGGRPDAWPVALPFLAALGRSRRRSRAGSACRAAARAGRAARRRRMRARCGSIARRTWRFFETFVGAGGPRAAARQLPGGPRARSSRTARRRRTSACTCSSTVAARDFGWIGTLDTVERLEATLETMQRLERFRGHFYNWYDTRRLPAARPEVRLVGRQRQPRRPPDRARAGLPRSMAAAPAHRPRTALAGIARRARRSCSRSASVADATDVRRVATPRCALGRPLDARHGRCRKPPAADDRGPMGRARLRGRSHGTRADGRSTVRGRARMADERSRRARRPEALVLGGGRCGATVASHARDLDVPRARSRAALAELALAERRARAWSRGHGLRLPLRSDAEAARRSATAIADGSPRLRAATTCSPPRRGSASFVAIAKGDVPVSHWFRLGRALTPVERGSALVSWSGSMFEYLMPSLVMRAPAGSLLEQTVAARRAPADHVRRRARRAVGRLGVGLQRARPRADLPVLELRRARARAASAGSARTSWSRPTRRRWRRWSIPRPRRGTSSGWPRPAGAARYGFYEALDYTAPRLPEGAARGRRARLHGAPPGDDDRRARQRPARRRDARALPRRADGPGDRAAAPGADAARRGGRAAARARRCSAVGDVREFVPPVVRRFTSPHGATPRTQLLSNGRYAVMLTAAGSGYSRWRDLAVTRWREDVTRDALGHVRVPARRRERRELVGRLPAERRRAGQLRGHVLRGPGRDRPPRRRDRDHARGGRLAGGRRRGPPRLAHEPRARRTREIELTSYAEVVLAPPAADAAHPAFSNLFVETECVAELDDRCSRRAGRDRAASARSGSPTWWSSRARRSAASQCETDRARFLGRGRGIRTPAAVIDGRPLSEHGRRRARSDREPAAPRAAAARRDGARRLLDARRAVARGGARPRREVSRPGDLRPRGDAGLDAGAGPAAPPRHRRPTRRTSSRASPAASSTPTATLRAARRGARAPAGRPRRAVGARHLGRPADRAGADRRARGRRASCASSCAPTSTGG